MLFFFCNLLWLFENWVVVIFRMISAKEADSEKRPDFFYTDGSQNPMNYPDPVSCGLRTTQLNIRRI